MRETEFPRMEHLALECSTTTIKRVPEQRMAKVFEVNADLMRAPGVQSAFDKTRFRQFFQNAVIRRSRPALSRFEHRHFLAMNRMPPNRGFYHARFFCQMPGDERKIDFQYATLGKLPRKPLVRLVVLGHHHATTGFLIEAVDNAGALFAADARQRSAMVEQCVDERSAGVSRRRMDDHSGLFIEHQQVVVFEKNLQWDRLSDGVGDRCCLGFVNRNGFTRPEFFPRFGRLPFDKNVPLLDERLEA